MRIANLTTRFGEVHVDMPAGYNRVVKEILEDYIDSPCYVVFKVVYSDGTYSYFRVSEYRVGYKNLKEE